MGDAGDAVFYQFSRSKVERGDFSHFLGLYSPDKLPSGRRLRQMMNSFVFCIEGYDDDECLDPRMWESEDDYD